MSFEPAHEQIIQAAEEANVTIPNLVQDAEAGETVVHQTAYQKTVANVAWLLKHANFHKTIIGLTLFDALCVFIDLAYAFLRECTTEERSPRPIWLEVFSYMSMVIVSMFLVEIPVTIWALGIQFYNPFKHGAASKLHFFDAAVIIATFVLEVALRGKDRDLASLLVILRLWRLFELAESIALSTSELHEHEKELLLERICHLTTEIEKLKAENQALRKRTGRRRSDPFSSPEREALTNPDPESASI
ncbi:hypothetical protein BJ165DRAFT_1523721 [Panaeolus papilionaceus]|nr:hypothetical protein BJ165DRAFT_1523721 [Panaeolus papilionaceus]